MRIVIDLQGAQTGSRYRGIGRYSLSLAKGIVRNRGDHEIILALSGLFPDTIDALYEEFHGLLPKENIKVWHAIGPTLEIQPEHVANREVAERIRESFLADLDPDVVLITSLFEGIGDDAIVSIGVLDKSTPTAVILYDLIPLINPDSHFRSNRLLRGWYKRKIEMLKQSKLLLAISDSAREEALSGLNFSDDSVVNISGACDEFFKSSEVARGNRSIVWAKFSINKPFVMYTGGADERKNLHRLIMAFAQLPSRVRKAHQLVFAGKMSEDYVKDYLATAKKFGMNDGELVLTGYVEDEDLLTLYNTCAVFAFPSLHEGFGIPPLEAMACGAAVIGSNATSLPEILGLPEAMFDPTSVPEMAGKLKQVLTDKAFHARLVMHGRQHFRKFSWDDSGRRAIAELERFDTRARGQFSRSLNIEKTIAFERRELKILAIKLDHLGDLILAIPAFTKLRAKYPYARIDAVVGSWNTSLAKKLAIFSNVYSYDFFKKKSSEAPETSEKILAAVLKQIGSYDIALDFRRQPDARFFLARTVANVKIAYETLDPEIDVDIDIAIKTYPDIPHKITKFNETSISNQMIRIVDALPSNKSDYVSYPSICEDIVRVPATVAVFPKAGNDVKEWSSENFSAYVNMLLGNSAIRAVNVYFANESEVNEFFFESSQRLHIHVGLSLNELTQSLAKNELCVANNSGGAHLASYLGVTVVGLYSGHEMADEWAPQFFDSYVIQRAAECAPCHGATRKDCIYDLFCLADITVKDVFNKSLEILSIENRSPGKVNVVSHPAVVRLQNNTDSIVRKLIKSIGVFLQSVDPQDILVLSRMIANNHPRYTGTGYVRLGATVDHRSSLIEWRGFSGIESKIRWTEGHRSEINFDCPDGVDPDATLELIFNVHGEQRIIARFNDVPIFEGVRRGDDVKLTLAVANLRSNSNKLILELPDAHAPGEHDRRVLGIAFRTLRIVSVQMDANAVVATI